MAVTNNKSNNLHSMKGADEHRGSGLAGTVVGTRGIRQSYYRISLVSRDTKLPLRG